jgi:hypothetical protein
MCTSARHVRLCGNRLQATVHRALQHARDRRDNVALGWMGDGPCDAGAREESAGAVAAARIAICEGASTVTNCEVNARCSTLWLIFGYAAPASFIPLIGFSTNSSLPVGRCCPPHRPPARYFERS